MLISSIDCLEAFKGWALKQASRRTKKKNTQCFLGVDLDVGTASPGRPEQSSDT